MTQLSPDDVMSGLLGRQLKISQVAAVCRDIEATMANYTRLLGWGPWNVYRYAPPKLHHTEVGGKPVEYTMIGAETHVGDIDFELLQPVSGPSIYRQWIDEHGEGLHHVAVMLHDLEESNELKRRFADEGMPVLMSGRVGDTIEFFYLDTEPSLKIIIESGSGHAIELTPDYVYP
jgi:catechol 2,3-dioxygenase-like lactoylglutathione lyase family enzyme